MRTPLLLLISFALIRIVSFGLFFFVPEAIRLYILTACSGVLIALFLFLYKKNPLLGFFVVLTEITLGGAGHYLEFFGVSLRTCLAILYLGLFFIFERKKIHIAAIPKPLLVSGLVFCGSILLSMVLGYKNGHPLGFIIQDAIPFLFLGLVFPARVYMKELVASSYIQSLVTVFIASNAFFSAITLSLFSFGVVHLQEPYYKWFRDVAMGKITDMGTGFFRIVLPEHLLLIPLALIFTSLIIQYPQKKLYRVLQIASLFTITINFSRIYFLALCTALLFLFSKKYIKKCLKESIFVMCLLTLIFSTTHLIVSRGNSFGLELFTSRAKSVIDPHSEISGATRMTLLPEIMTQIKKSPLLGSGLGATVSFTDPVTGIHKETRQFDWGYLEMWTETGFIGIVSFFTLILCTIFLYKKNALNTEEPIFICGAIAGCVALIVITLTTPALIHVFGIFFTSFFFAFSAPYRTK